MCSINGFSWDDKKLIKKMTDVTAHRGPDDLGFYTDNNISLGHARLSVIDTSKQGHQPMESDNFIIVYNGELYNYKEIRETLTSYGYTFASNSDTEVILKAYQEYGITCLKKFNGMFAFAIYNKKDHSLFFARDPLGVKPLYYTLYEKNIVFASEIKAILEHPLQREVDPIALAQYLKFGYTPPPRTMFSQIYKLPPAHYAIFSDNVLNIKQYDSLTFGDRTVMPSEVREQLMAAVKRHLMSDVPLGAYLSGGLDSSSIVACMKQFSDDITTFSVGFDSREVINELPYARAVAEVFDTHHTEVVVDTDNVTKVLPSIAYHLDEPIANAASVPLFMMAKVAKNNSTVVLTGNGGDELFAGYRQHALIGLAQEYYKKAPTLIGSSLAKHASDLLHALSPARYKKYTGFAHQLLMTIDEPQGSYEALMYKNFNAQDRHTIMRDHPQIPNVLQPFFSQKTALINQLLAIDLGLLLPENYLMVDDKINMAHGVESRVPFLDRSFVQFALQISSKQKVHNLNGKIILKKAMKPLLPSKTVSRNKYGFTPPLRHWIQNGLLDHTIAQFENKEVAKFYNQSELEKIWSVPIHENKIFPLAMWAEWYNQYFL